MKPLSNILTEIESLKSRQVMFIDDNFIGNRKEVKKMLPVLARNGATLIAATAMIPGIKGSANGDVMAIASRELEKA